ncbi:hypothetical protein [Microbacterium sp. H1-D42]|uniref:hypothetical protein n=1 Tax=Microbacterium sp. H1-D42 TaxID=2925844 RepID=UPI001F53205B|nr:hypothetical protein [Microbacterium sp. H1-D42]UNK71661.1 hypothetical protein MNR00_04145 [Microbacterium sp. H1-D42]
MSSIRLRSSSAQLQQIFDWARTEALGHRVDGGAAGPRDVSERTPDGLGEVRYSDAYWAGYSHRSGYYSRDFAHQAVGAHLLGMAERNDAMLGSFLRSATPEHDGWPLWALNFDRRTPLQIDYLGPDRFVRELPAVFELAETAHVLQRWTGHPLSGDALAAVIDFVGVFVDRHDLSPRNGVAGADGPGIFDGTASYNELPGVILREAGDGFGAQYAATRHVAALVAADGGDASALQARADALMTLYRQTWSRGEGDAVVCGWTPNGHPIQEWSRESTWFPLLKGLLVDERAAAELDRVDRLGRDSETAPKNIEALTYLPDLFFRHGLADTAWSWMQRIFALRDEPHEVVQQGRNGSYPEVSFTLLSQIALGIVGVEADAGNARLTLRPGLPTGVDDVELTGIPFADGTVDVRIDRAGCRVANRTAHALRIALGQGGFRDPHLSGPERAGSAVTIGAGDADVIAVRL